MSGGKRFRPLDSDEARDFEEAAEEFDDFLTSLTGRALLLLGLRPNEFVHSIPEWIVRRGTRGRFLFDITPYEDIPGRSDECTKARGEGKQGNPEGMDMYERGQPCSDCRKSGETDGFEGKTSNAGREYPLDKSPELKRLGDDFLWYFEQHDFIPFGNAGVNRRVREIAEKAGLDDENRLGTKTIKYAGREQEVPDINAYDLRHTYGTRLARMGFSATEIKSMMGHGSTKMPEQYISFTGVRKGNIVEEKWDSNIY